MFYFCASYASYVPIKSRVYEKHINTGIHKPVPKAKIDLNQPKIKVEKDERINNKTGPRGILVPKPT